jgi:GTP cyclohydrolase I
MTSKEQAARAIEDFLRAIGHEPIGELEGTGQRVADAWIDELLCGRGVDPVALLREGSLDLGAGPHGPVVLRDLAVTTICPHHLLPAFGRATIGVVPRRRAAGLGVLAQAVDALARRLTLQEQLGEHIARALSDGLDAEGAFCRLVLTHTCFVSRGERQAGSVVESLALEGCFATDRRDLALALAYGRST